MGGWNLHEKIALPWATSVSWWHELTVREIRSSYSASYPFQIVSMLVIKKFHYMTFVARWQRYASSRILHALFISRGTEVVDFPLTKRAEEDTWNQGTLRSYSFFLISSHIAAGVFFALSMRNTYSFLWCTHSIWVHSGSHFEWRRFSNSPTVTKGQSFVCLKEYANNW